MVVFSDMWFVRHQPVLVGLLRLPLIGRWFRWVLCIRKHDEGYAKPIVALLPHAYIVANNDGSFTLDCRTHAKYAKRLYYAFRPIWWALHAWDWAVADRFIPALSAGCATLPDVFPDAGTGNTTVDGAVFRGSVDESWAAIRGGAGTTTDQAGRRITQLQASTTSNQWANLYRAIQTFNTAGLGATATVVSATVSYFGAAVGDTLGLSPEANVNVFGSTPAADNNLATADYSQVGTTAYCDTPLVVSAWSTSGYNAFALNATGLAAISTTGITRLGTRNANYDAANTTPGSWSSGAFYTLEAYNADEAGTTNDPKLSVTYTVPMSAGGYGAWSAAVVCS